jgi:hypothetical protein
MMGKTIAACTKDPGNLIQPFTSGREEQHPRHFQIGAGYLRAVY